MTVTSFTFCLVVVFLVIGWPTVATDSHHPYQLSSPYKCPPETPLLTSCVNDADGSGVDQGCTDKQPFCVDRQRKDPLHHQLGSQCVSCLIESWCLSHWLALSNHDLFEAGFNKNSRIYDNLIGDYCRVVHSTTGACRYYAFGSRSPLQQQYYGVPRKTPNDVGTGCVKERRDQRHCYMREPGYNLTQNEREAMCTDDYKSNAGAQIRHGIRNAQRYCVKPGTPLPCQRFIDDSSHKSTDRDTRESKNSGQRAGMKMLFWMATMVVLLSVVAASRSGKRQSSRRMEASATPGMTNLQLTNLDAEFRYTALGSGDDDDSSSLE